jgi:hypothetical protein
LALTWVALKAIYPEQDFSELQFTKVPQGYWQDRANQRAWLDNLAHKLGFTKPEDWYSIKISDVRNHGGSGLLAHYDNSLVQSKHCIDVSNELALQQLYPEYNWTRWSLFKSHRVQMKRTRDSLLPSGGQYIGTLVEEYQSDKPWRSSWPSISRRFMKGRVDVSDYDQRLSR